MIGEPPGAKEGGTFIDQALRDRVAGDITAFLTAFDAALAHDTPESRAGLRDATDRLLRKDDDNVLTISTLASLAAKWLLPRLSAGICFYCR